MEVQSLVDKYCADAHSAPVTAAAYDPQSGGLVTADEWGVVAITRPGDAYPGFIFQPGGPVQGAVAISIGGALVAVGDDYGTVAVYKTYDGTCVFHDVKEDGGEARAMRACAFHPDGTVLATLSVDGIIRVFDIQRWERIANYQGFDGHSLDFDPRGDRLLAIDNLGQPKILDMEHHEILDLELIPGGCQVARFSADNRHAVCLGLNAINLLRLPSGRIVNSFTARGSSGLLTMLIDPPGHRVAAVTQRSVHLFSLPDLRPVDSQRHGAAEPTPAAFWDARGIAVGGRDGQFHRPGAAPSLDPLVCVTGYGQHRVAVHGDRIAVWHKTRRRRPFKGREPFVEVKIDRDGRLLCGVPADESAGLKIFEAKTGRMLFDAGPETAGTPKVEVGGPVVACALPAGGMRWYDLKNNNTFELPWVSSFALSGGGTWIGVVDPKGHVRVLDPATGEDAVVAPEPLADCPVRLVSFVNRRPDMLVLDEEGVLSIYDLAVSVTDGVRATGRDVFQLNVDVDRLWGITGGRFAALRIQELEQGTATVIFVDIRTGEVVSELADLLPYVWVDPEDGCLLQPARGNALLEIDMHGQERRVLRTLPEGEWICFDGKRILDQSEGAG